MRTLNWKCYWTKIHTKLKRSSLTPWAWLNKRFQIISRPWMWYKKKEIGFRMNLNQETNGVFLPEKNCSKGKRWRFFFLHQIVMGDKRWMHYDNPKRKKLYGKPSHASISTTKLDISSKKLWLCILCDVLRVFCYEILQPNKTITRERYQAQLLQLRPRIEAEV